MSAPVAPRSLSRALRQVAARGFAHVDGLVGEGFLRELRREVEGGPLRRMAGSFGAAGVRMEIDGYDLEAPFAGFPVLSELAGSFTARVRSDGAQIRGLRTWRPNEAGVAVYRSGSVGVTSHLDGRWYRRLVAVFTVGGSARFEVRSSREGALLQRWEARAGSVTLMRAPGLAGVRDGRPYHAVHGPPRGTRCSLALRMRVEAEDASARAGEVRASRLSCQAQEVNQ